jgi:DNA-binding transcriptional MerR regulator
MTIEEAAQASGLSADTIRFYDRQGMLPPLPRDKRGWRFFDAGALDWLRNLARLRATGMPMAEMNRFAVLVHARGAETPAIIAERLSILERHNERLASRRAELDAAQSYLDTKIRIYRERMAQ